MRRGNPVVEGHAKQPPQRDTEETEQDTSRQRLRKLGRILVLFLWLMTVVGTVLVFVAAVAGSLGKWDDYAGRLAHFPAYYLAASVVAVCILLLLRSWRWAAIALLCCLFNGWAVATWYLPAPNVAGVQGVPLRVLLSNVSYKNKRPARVLAEVARVNPDLLVTLEVTDGINQAFQPLHEHYPYSCEDLGRSWTYGLSVYSRYPLTPILIDEESPLLGRALMATMLVEGNPVTVIAVHPNGVYSRNPKRFGPQMDALAELVQDSPAPCLVVGDLNTTMWSSDYKSLVKATGLTNVRQGFGILPTWPAQHAPFMIPIDHCLCTPELRAVSCGQGSLVGSDHLPFRVDLVVQAGRGNKLARGPERKAGD